MKKIIFLLTAFVLTAATLTGCAGEGAGQTPPNTPASLSSISTETQTPVKTPEPLGITASPTPVPKPEPTWVRGQKDRH